MMWEYVRFEDDTQVSYSNVRDILQFIAANHTYICKRWQETMGDFFFLLLTR